MSSAVLASDVNVAQNVGFYIIAAGMVWGALRSRHDQERRPRARCG